MKRLNASLILGLFFSFFCFAQEPQTGNASYNSSRTGFFISHHTLSFNTHVRVTNLGNNRSVEAVVNGRPSSSDRIADISRDAGDALEMAKTGMTPVKIEVLPPRQAAEPVSVESSAQAAGDTQNGNASYNSSRTGFFISHHTLSFNTLVRVTNLENNRSVEAVVNRRPLRSDRIADISREAGDALGMAKTGMTLVKIEPIPAKSDPNPVPGSESVSVDSPAQAPVFSAEPTPQQPSAQSAHPPIAIIIVSVIVGLSFLTYLLMKKTTNATPVRATPTSAAPAPSAPIAETPAPATPAQLWVPVSPSPATAASSTPPAAAIDPAFYAIIQKITAERGVKVLANTALCKALLQDYTGGIHKKESRLFLQALEAGCGVEILQTQEPDITRQRLIHRLHEDYSVDRDAAEGVVALLYTIIDGKAG
jgi:rare lipoprotein A (peptidoglycan hydrolase)